jgi:hypothetical protein
MMPLIINAELQSLIPPLTTEEYTQLEANIVADGCRDPLIVWQEEQTLLDGHNRYEICERHGLRYTTLELSLPDMESAHVWMIENQLGRRNLTLDQMRYYRGKQYELKKKIKRGGGDRKSAEARHQKPHNEAFDNTAHELAVQHKVSKATIERDAVYAKAIDTIADVAGPEARRALLGRETKVTQQEVKTLAKMATKSASKAKEALDAVQGAKTPKQARQIVREKAREVRDYEQYMDAMARSEGLAQWPPPARPQAVEHDAWDEVYDAKLARLLTRALSSLDALHGHLIGNKEDWSAVHLPAALERQRVACLKLEEQWWLVEHLFVRSETLRHVPLDEDPYSTACAIVDTMGCAYASDLARELLTLVTTARDEAAQGAEEAERAPVTREDAGSLIMAVWLAVQQLQPCTNAQVAKVLGEERNRVHQALQSLVKQGKARKEGLTYSVVEVPTGKAIADGVVV